MDTSFIIVIILIAIFVLNYNTYITNYFNYVTDKHSKSKVSVTDKHSPIFSNVNMKNICKKLNLESKAKPDSGSDSGSDSDSDTCECNKKKPKPLTEQLLEQKKLYNELKLHCDDTNDTSSYISSDLYLVGSQYVGGDDVFTNRMLDMTKQSKIATDARSMWSKNSLVPYLEEELEEYSQAGGWWDAEDLEQEF